MAQADPVTSSLLQIRDRAEQGPKNPRVRAHAMRREIAEYFRSAIRTGTLAPGQKLPPERDLARDLQANRKTVRDSLIQLQEEGFVVRRQGSGTYVASTTPEQTPGRLFPTPTVSPLDVIEVRRVIEPHYLDLVVGRATEDDFARMRARLEDMESATDQVTFKAAGYAFHLEVVRATRNPLLIAIYEMLIAARAKAGWSTLMPLNERKEQRDGQIAANRSIYEAVNCRNANRACELAMLHLTEMLQAVATFPPGA
jgi:GntR family transcriptional repressor for pyruvate dehydrogenase complex